ncbi:hypothetical protein HAALTHF_42360n [Vreelandella aquamarina]|nr:hypothetical protein HAALTHF_42360n [Halomonas axialensis]
MSFYVYLSGEIHTDWREEIQRGAEAAGLDVVFTAPVTDHDASDAAGDHLGKPENGFWRDHQSSKVNAIRTRTLIEQADLVVVRFGDKYKQWNAAFDAGYCAALAKPYITLAQRRDRSPAERSRRPSASLVHHHRSGRGNPALRAESVKHPKETPCAKMPKPRNAMPSAWRPSRK